MEGHNRVAANILEGHKHVAETDVDVANTRQLNNNYRRLADKIECTTDCFVSDDQGASISTSLSRTHNDTMKLTELINNYASNGRDSGGSGSGSDSGSGRGRGGDIGGLSDLLKFARRLRKGGEQSPDCYVAGECEFDMRKCHDRCKMVEGRKWCSVETKSNGEKVGFCKGRGHLVLLCYLSLHRLLM